MTSWILYVEINREFMMLKLWIREDEPENSSHQFFVQRRFSSLPNYQEETCLHCPTELYATYTVQNLWIFICKLSAGINVPTTHIVIVRPFPSNFGFSIGEVFRMTRYRKYSLHGQLTTNMFSILIRWSLFSWSAKCLIYHQDFNLSPVKNCTIDFRGWWSILPIYKYIICPLYIAMMSL
jgi:hypothetical protein